MKMKKAIAGILASVVAVSAMATMAVSAQTADTKDFETYSISYQAKANLTFAVASGAANGQFSIDLSDLTGAFGAANLNEDDSSLKVTSLTIDGTKYTEKDDIEFFSTTDKATGIVTITPIGLEATKLCRATVELVSDKLATKAGATALVDAAKLTTYDVADVSTAGAPSASFGAVTGSTTTNKEYLPVTASYATGDLDDYFPGITASLANYIASNRDVKVTFYFEANFTADEEEASAPGYSQDTGWTGANSEDFAIRINNTKALAGLGEIDEDAMTITFDWDDVLSSSNLTNAVGQVWQIDIKGNTDGFLYVDGAFGYDITKIVVDIPESATEPDVVPDASSATEPASSAADPSSTDAPNPGTGNAPIALAVIPVALAAAAIVASKKRS